METDGEDIAVPGPALGMPYDPEMRAMLRQALDDAQTVAAGAPVPYSIRDAERRLTEAHAEAVEALLMKAGLAPRQVALIGFHGRPFCIARPSAGPGRSATARCWRG